MNAGSLLGTRLLGLGAVMALIACGGDDREPVVDAAVDASAPIADADAGVDTGTIPPACDPQGGESLYYVLDDFLVARPDPADPTVVAGENLDGLVSDDLDGSGCFHPDFRSGAPDEIDGVDSQLGVLLVDLGIDDDLEQDFDDAIAVGQFLVLLAVHDVGDRRNDDCVQVELVAGLLPSGVTAPTIEPSGRFSAGQRFDVDTTAMVPGSERPWIRFLNGSIQDGRIRASSESTLDIGLPIRGVADALLVRHHAVRIRLTITDSGIEDGVIAARTDIDEIVQINEERLTAPALDFLDAAFFRVILQTGADMNPRDGRCESLSLSHLFQGVGANWSSL